eukprot:scaffold10249_cov59-Cyclotella_meneghiniana.AAC.4
MLTEVICLHASSPLQLFLPNASGAIAVASLPFILLIQQAVHGCGCFFYSLDSTGGAVAVASLCSILLIRQCDWRLLYNFHSLDSTGGAIAAVRCGCFSLFYSLDSTGGVMRLLYNFDSLDSTGGAIAAEVKQQQDSSKAADSVYYEVLREVDSID